MSAEDAKRRTRHTPDTSMGSITLSGTCISTLDFFKPRRNSRQKQCKRCWAPADFSWMGQMLQWSKADRAILSPRCGDRGGCREVPLSWRDIGDKETLFDHSNFLLRRRGKASPGRFGSRSVDCSIGLPLRRER